MGGRYTMTGGYWALTEIARMILEDFKKPETEAEYQAWLAKKEEKERDQENEEKRTDL